MGVEVDSVEFPELVQFTQNPRFGNLEAPLKFRQPRDMSDGGVLYVYDKGITEQKFVLKWESLPLADWTALKTFIDTVAVGAKNTFTYYDEDGTAWTVRLISDTRDFRQVRFGRYSGSLTLLKVA